jgi:hypothetical protein
MSQLSSDSALAAHRSTIASGERRSRNVWCVLLASAAILQTFFAAGDARAENPKAPPRVAVRTAAATGKGDGAPKHGSGRRHPAGAAKPAPKPEPAETPPAKAEVPAETPKPDASHGGAPTHSVVEHESHIEFDERMVKGQTAAGAIYLFQRSPTEFKTIVQVPESFRPRTVAILASHRGGP